METHIVCGGLEHANGQAKVHTKFLSVLPLKMQLGIQSDQDEGHRVENSYLITGARVVDPFSHRDVVDDIYIENGLICEAPDDIPAGTERIDATGLIAAPAFVDLHVHFREPGGEQSETIASGCRAAEQGGFGTVVPMPNTNPPIDNPDRMAWQVDEARRHGGVEVVPSACITIGRNGEQLTDMRALAEAGAAFFTDDGSTVMSDDLMRAAMCRSAELGLAVVDHAQRSSDERVGVMHAGKRSAELGLPGIPTEAETFIIERDIRLAEETGCAIHIQHITSAAGAELVRRGKERGARVTAEVTPHHIALCDGDVAGDDANFKMNPPLRSAEDRAALREALSTGVIDCFATDHAPHAADLKARGFLEAPFGVVGLETAVGVTYTDLVATGRLDIYKWVECWTAKPMRLLPRKGHPLLPGEPGRIVLIDPSAEWVVDPQSFNSLSSNTCFGGRTLLAKVSRTILPFINL